MQAAFYSGLATIMYFLAILQIEEISLDRIFISKNKDSLDFVTLFAYITNCFVTAVALWYHKDRGMSEELPLKWSIEPKERVRALSELASGTVNVSPTIPIKRYYRSGIELEKMAKVYEDEKTFEKAFFLYCKYTTERDRGSNKHLTDGSVGEYKSPETSSDRKAVRAKLKTVFDRAETIKKVLELEYGDQYRKWCKDEQIRKAEAEQRRLEEEAGREAAEYEAQKREMERKESELAEELAQIEAQLAETRVIATAAIAEPIRIPPPMNRQATYPTLDGPVAPSPQQVGPSNSMVPLPPQYSAQSVVSLPPSAQSLPTAPSVQSIPPSYPGVAATPQVDRSTKPALPSVDSIPTPRGPLRPVVVPTTLPAKFLSVCIDNTQRNVETCGILAAKLTSNSFTITHVIIPKQRGTSDSCQTLHEEELFEYQDKLDLITLGWIHNVRNLVVVVQSDPYLVTFSGERVLVTKSGWALNRAGQAIRFTDSKHDSDVAGIPLKHFQKIHKKIQKFFLGEKNRVTKSGCH
eukprot:sb/3463848/